VRTAQATVDRYRSDPVAFCREVLGFEAWSKQAAILESVRDHKRTAVRSAHGVGKTSTAARAVLWWLASFPSSIAITTSATWNQVREQLWRELAIGFREARGFINGTLTETRLDLGPDWFALGISTDTPERFAGYHSDRLLVILDEASGVSEAVWEAAETLITSPGGHLLALGNPTRPSGSFYRAFTTEQSLFNGIHVSAFDSPAVTGEPVASGVRARLVSAEWIEERRRAWGEDSPLFAIRVKGEFPSSADDAVVGLAALEAAQARAVEPGFPVVVSVDVARFGSDLTTIAVRRGGRVRVVRAYGGRDTMQTVGEVIRVCRQVTRETNVSRPTLVVDEGGLGAGVVDRLREKEGELRAFRLRPFDAARRALNASDYRRRRDEAWFTFADKLPGLDLDPRDGEVAADLLAPRYSVDSDGRLQVEPKERTKSRLGRSPDRGDAVVMAFTVREGEGVPPGWVGDDDESAISRRRRGRSPLSAEYEQSRAGLDEIRERGVL
jgi:phage terminase large subunit